MSTDKSPQIRPVGTELTEECKQKTLKYSVIEGSFAGLNQTLIDNYITPFALLIGATTYQIGVMNSIAGLIMPLGQIWGSNLIVSTSRKKLLFLFALFHAISMLMVLALDGDSTITSFFAMWDFYQSC